MSISKKQWLAKLVLLLLLLSLAEGCVYYNAFYLTRKWFNQAEDSRKAAGREVAAGGEVKQYQDAIKKSSKIISEHPGSGYVDDALFIIGKSYYYLQDYAKAERKFRELMSSFPKSKYFEESRFFLGKTRFQQENYVLAGETFTQMIEKNKNSTWRAEAVYLMGESSLKQGDSTIALEYYQRFVKEYKSDNKSSEVQFKIGQIQFQRKEYSQAVAAYSAAESMSKDDKTKFQAQYERGRSLYMIDSVAMGLALFRKLADEPKDTLYLGDILLRVAEGENLIGEQREAILLYNDIATKYANKPPAVEAFCRTGLIVEDDWGDLVLAKDMFDQAAKITAAGNWHQIAVNKSADITKVEKYRNDIAGGDTDALDDNQFLLAELYHTSLNQPDSALSEYRNLINDYPGSDLAPKALLAVGWLEESHAHDTAAAREAYRRVIDDYPTSDEYGAAVKLLGLMNSEVDTVYVDKLYAQAEEQYFDRGNADSAIFLFQELIRRFPDSRFAPQADFAIARIKLSNFVPKEKPDDSTFVDSTMIVIFRDMSQRFPNSPYGAEAAKLASGILTPTKANRPVEQPQPTKDTLAPTQDTTTLAEKGDTLTPAQKEEEDLKKELDTTPMITSIQEPTTKGEFIYPMSACASKVQGRVMLKIKIEIDGKVSEVAFLKRPKGINGEDVPDVERAIRKAMLETYFDAIQFDAAKLASGYFIYNYDVKLPEICK